MFIIPALSMISMMLLATNQPISPPVRSYYGDFLAERGAENTGYLPGYPYPSLAPGAQGLECRPIIEKSLQMAVDVKPDLEWLYVNNPAHPAFNKETKTDGTQKSWMLVKRNAPIPAWKVWGGGGHCDRSPDCGEMEMIGNSIPAITDPTNGASNQDLNKEVFIGIGWCDPTDIPAPAPGSSGGEKKWIQKNGCLDPLTQDVLFIPTRKGALHGQAPDWVNSHQWGRDDSINDPPKTKENLELYYWTFDVYYNMEKVDADPTYEELPEWMKLQCPRGSDVWGLPRCKADPNCHCAMDPSLPGCTGVTPVVQSKQSTQLAGQVQGTFETAEGNPRLVIRNDELDNINRSLVPPGITLLDTYVSLGEVPGVDPSVDILLGTAYKDHFNVWLRLDTQAEISTANHALILDPTITGRPGPFFIFGPILSVAAPNNNNLQLGTFNPGLPLLAKTELPTSLYYEWWTPSCKPALYLYPEKPTNVSVQVHPEGYITQSIPPYGQSGWNVKAYPDGTIQQLVTDNPKLKTSTYPYLYYEAAINKLAVSKDNGWVKKTDELPYFFADVLQKLGLNTQESKDFMEYWIPKFSEGNNWYITLIDDSELNRVEPLTVNPKPDTMIRVRFYFENLDDQPIKLSHYKTVQTPSTQNLIPTTKPVRTGFTLVDWGGIVGNGSCGVDEVSQ